MATETLITPEQYLRMAFGDADAELVDGRIVERNVGENEHSCVQFRLGLLFHELAQKHPLHIRPELRLRVSATRFRVADLAVFLGARPTESVPATPPLVVAEIVSPDDRYTEIVSKLEDYRKWGVRHIWLIDPWSHKLHRYDETGLHEVTSLDVPELGLDFTPGTLFEQ